jgi:hypothetical protein
MEAFSELNPGCAAIPMLCVDVEDMKLLVSEWSASDEQFANQIIEGSIDPRIPPKLGNVIARLHCSPFDPQFNTGAARSECIQGAFTLFEGFYQTIMEYSYDYRPRVKATAKRLGETNIWKLWRKVESPIWRQRIVWSILITMLSISWSRATPILRNLTSLVVWEASRYATGKWLLPDPSAGTLTFLCLSNA